MQNVNSEMIRKIIGIAFCFTAITTQAGAQGLGIELNREAFAQLRHFLTHRHDSLLGFGYLLGGLALAVEKEEAKADADDKKNGDAGGPLFYAAAEPDQVAAQFEDAGFEAFRGG